jgi:hypothetical protein
LNWERRGHRAKREGGTREREGIGIHSGWEMEGCLLDAEERGSAKKERDQRAERVRESETGRMRKERMIYEGRTYTRRKSIQVQKDTTPVNPYSGNRHHETSNRKNNKKSRRSKRWSEGAGVAELVRMSCGGWSCLWFSPRPFIHDLPFSLCLCLCLEARGIMCSKCG